MSVFNVDHLGPWAVLWIDTRPDNVPRSAWAFFTARDTAIEFRDTVGGELYVRAGGGDGNYKLA